jgi:hypothetical protein
MARDWRIVHISGHGEPPELVGSKPGALRGVALSDNLFLGPHEINSMRVVPELVFVNCCFLATRSIGQLLDPGEGRGRPYHRARFASTVADALIDIGVRCVIAAGWAVEDEPASAFATTFYGALLEGRRFIDAVSEAREAAHKLGGNTWAAYQCYGDPDWVFRPGAGDAQRPRRSYGDEFAAIASPDTLVLALQTIGLNSAFNREPDETRQIDRMRYLENRFRGPWGTIGSVAAAFGRTWSLMGYRAKAMEWLKQARAAQDGTAPLEAMEELANLHVRVAWEDVVRQAPGPARQAALPAARDGIDEACKLLDTLLAIGPTVERENLYGSAFKRLAMIAVEAGDAVAERDAITGMKLHYGRAEEIAKAVKAPNLYYPAMNRMAADLALLEGHDTAVPPGDVAAARESLVAAALKEPDFWSVVGQTELSMYEALFARTLSEQLAALTAEFTRLYERVPRARRNWSSVYDNATFVLHKYRKHAPRAERKAAEELLEQLKSFGADR